MDKRSLAITVEDVYDSLDGIVDSLEGEQKEKVLELIIQLDELRDLLLDQVDEGDPDDLLDNIIDVEKVPF